MLCAAMNLEASVFVRVEVGSETLGNGTYATAGRGGRLRHARGYAPPRIHRRGWLARDASRFSGVGARPRTPVPERARRTTTRVQPEIGRASCRERV